MSCSPLAGGDLDSPACVLPVQGPPAYKGTSAILDDDRPGMQRSTSPDGCSSYSPVSPPSEPAEYEMRNFQQSVPQALAVSH